MGLLVQWACPLWFPNHIPNLTVCHLLISTEIPEIREWMTREMSPRGFVSFQSFRLCIPLVNLDLPSTEGWVVSVWDRILL